MNIVHNESIILSLMFSDICFPHISLHELIFLIPHYRSLAHYGSVHYLHYHSVAHYGNVHYLHYTTVVWHTTIVYTTYTTVV